MNMILITAIWCPSCIIMRPRYNDLAKNKEIAIKEFDFDDDEEEIKKYQIGTTLPVAIIYDKDQNEILRITGEKSVKELNKFLEKIGK